MKANEHWLLVVFQIIAFPGIIVLVGSACYVGCLFVWKLLGFADLVREAARVVWRNL